MGEGDELADESSVISLTDWRGEGAIELANPAAIGVNGAPSSRDWKDQHMNNYLPRTARAGRAAESLLSVCRVSEARTDISGPGGERGMRACDIERCRVRAIALMRQLSKVRREVNIGVLTICDYVESDAQRERNRQNQGGQSAEKGDMQRNLANGSVTTPACCVDGVPRITLTNRSVEKNAPSGAFHK